MSHASSPLKSLTVNRPTLLLDKNRAIRNIQRMQKKADRAGLRFRPHFKTHQSAAIGAWFRRLGCKSITVSSLDMAAYFADHGWKNITVAFTANLLEGKAMKSLGRKTQLNLLLDSAELARGLPPFLPAKTPVWIDVDVGYHRTGIPWDDFSKIITVARAVRSEAKLSLAGLLTHSGHTYQAKSPLEIRRIHKDSLLKLRAVKKRLQEEGIHPCEISIGDTPSCSAANSFAGADEIRPGNFIFYDLTMSTLGVCRDEDIAVAVACPVVAKYESWNQVVIYGGAVHLSKEFLLDERGRRVYGYPAFPGNASWGPAERKAPIVSLSQEHGLIEMNDSFLRQTKVGDLLAILPVHSCLTADLYRSYLALDGKKIERRQSNDRG
ncbi:MAG: alanine racemase [Syntrophaceae bacterium]|nr:alanine racemase [Syntrophaceae bacterium]